MLRAIKHSKNDKYNLFKARYFSTFMLSLIFLSIFGQTIWVLKDIIIDGARGTQILVSVIFRNLSLVVYPAYVISYKHNKCANWWVAFTAVWVSIIGTVVYNMFIAHHNEIYTGDGYLVYFIWFFAVSIAANNQIPLYLSYLVFPLLILCTSVDFGGTVIYSSSISWTMVVGISMSAGLITISKLIRDMFVKFYEKETSLVNISELDQLTGCYNRHRLDKITDGSYALRGESTLFIIDVDHLKKINDDHGHLVGDEVIRYVANCLKESVRIKDFVIRYGGDEFIIIFDGLIKELDVYTRILEQMEIDNKYDVTLSIGTTRVTKDNLDLKQAIKRADIAAYQSKVTRNRMTVFEDIQSDKAPISADELVEQIV